MKLEKKQLTAGISYIILPAMLHMGKCVRGLCFIYFLKFISIYTYIIIIVACQKTMVGVQVTVIVPHLAKRWLRLHSARGGINK